MDKNHPEQNLPDKRPLTKPPDKNPREQLRENLYRGLLSGIFVLGQLKIGGSEMCEYFGGVPGCVTKCDRGGGSKLAKNSDILYGQPLREKCQRIEISIHCRNLNVAPLQGGY